MEASEYARVHALEASHWWYRTLHESISRLIDQRGARSGLLIDAGCGTGGIRTQLPDYSYCGLDCSPDALTHLTHELRIRGSVEHLPFTADQAAVLLSIDVLYHAWVESCAAAATEALRVLRPRGLAVFHVPAIPLLKSDHDRVVMGRRRFTLSRFVGLLERAGFSLEFSSYQFSFLVPFALAERLIGRKGSRLRPHRRITNTLLATIGRAESRLLERGITLPIGTSLIVVARKPDPHNSPEV